MAASTKVQLGARVAPDVKERAAAAAKAAGVSLNVWVERTLAGALDTGRDDPASDADARPSRAPRRAPVVRASDISQQDAAMRRQAKLNADRERAKAKR